MILTLHFFGGFACNMFCACRAFFVDFIYENKFLNVFIN